MQTIINTMAATNSEPEFLLIHEKPTQNANKIRLSKYLTENLITTVWLHFLLSASRDQCLSA